MMQKASVLDLIGNTPVVDVSNLSPNPRVRLIAKLESQNPFGSVKDRIAKSMIEQAIAEGKLKPGQRIMEPSSGNTGIALAAIAGVKGNPITILMPDSVSIERRQMLEVFGRNHFDTRARRLKWCSAARRSPCSRAPRVVLYASVSKRCKPACSLRDDGPRNLA